VGDNLDRLRAALSERYEIIRELARGGMAIVYLARDPRHERLVAIKVMRPEVSAQSSTQRFLREIKVAARLQHPHILTVHDSGMAGDDLYYVMPFVEGESLRQRVDRGPLPVADALEITREVADALDYAHSQGIIHRDIKPENILLTAGRGNTGGHAVVADFGIARAIEIPDGEASATGTGIAVGSPAYMSPEQALGVRDLDETTDIYSLGCVLYEMLTGEPPFGRRSARAAMAGHVSGEPASVSQQRAHVPPGVLEAVDRAMAKRPEDRFATAAAFRDALRVDTATVGIARGGATRRQYARMAALAAGVAALAGAGTVILARSGSGAVPGDRAAVVIADVDNATGDQVFRNSLVTALAAGLGQSDQVTLVSRSRIAETLARMQRGGDSVLSERVAREAAVREGWGAIVVPSIAVFDSTYIITARILDPRSGGELATRTVRARTKGEIVDAVDDLTRALRRDFGESILSVMRSSHPLPDVTTASLDALEKFAAGSRAWDAGRMQEAKAHFAGALALDSNFALAHVAMGRYLYWQNSGNEADKHFARALANANRITDRERMWASAQMASSRGDWQQAATNYRAYLSRYPGYSVAWLNLGTTLMRDSRPREALAAFTEFTKLDSTSGSAYINMATSYSMLARYDSAIVFYRKAFAVRPEWETWFNINHEYGMMLAKANRMAEARAVFQKMVERPGASDQARGHRSLALLELLNGRPAAAVPRLRQAIQINASLKEALSEARNHVFLVAAYELAGDMTAARAEADRAFAIFSAGYLDPVMAARIGRALVRSGRLPQAARVVDSVRARVRQGNNFEEAHYLLAAAELAQATGARDSARALIQRAAVLDSSAETLAPTAAMRADAGDLSGAIGIERRIRDSHANVGYEAQFPWSLSRYRLGRLHEREGDAARARKEYEEFLSEWSGADPALPAIMDTRARLRRLMALQPKREGGT
jgi:eukaryotic-like serine/threonine-protein kinase